MSLPYISKSLEHISPQHSVETVLAWRERVLPYHISQDPYSGSLYRGSAIANDPYDLTSPLRNPFRETRVDLSSFSFSSSGPSKAYCNADLLSASADLNPHIPDARIGPQLIIQYSSDEIGFYDDFEISPLAQYDRNNSIYERFHDDAFNFAKNDPSTKLTSEDGSGLSKDTSVIASENITDRDPQRPGKAENNKEESQKPKENKKRTKKKRKKKKKSSKSTKDSPTHSKSTKDSPTHSKSTKDSPTHSKSTKDSPTHSKSKKEIPLTELISLMQAKQAPPAGDCHNELAKVLTFGPDQTLIEIESEPEADVPEFCDYEKLVVVCFTRKRTGGLGEKRYSTIPFDSLCLKCPTLAECRDTFDELSESSQRQVKKALQMELQIYTGFSSKIKQLVIQHRPIVKA